MNVCAVYEFGSKVKPRTVEWVGALSCVVQCCLF